MLTAVPKAVAALSSLPNAWGTSEDGPAGVWVSSLRQQQATLALLCQTRAPLDGTSS